MNDYYAEILRFAQNDAAWFSGVLAVASSDGQMCGERGGGQALFRKRVTENPARRGARETSPMLTARLRRGRCGTITLSCYLLGFCRTLVCAGIWDG